MLLGDGVAADAERLAGVVEARRGGAEFVECEAERDDLGDRAEFEDAAGDAVEAVGLVGILEAGGILVGERDGREQFAAVDIHEDAGRGVRLVLLHGRVERVGDGVLDAEIDRQADRRIFARRRRRGGRFGGADGVDMALDAGDAAVVDVDLAGDVAGEDSASGRRGAARGGRRDRECRGRARAGLRSASGRA